MTTYSSGLTPGVVRIGRRFVFKVGEGVKPADRHAFVLLLGEHDR